MKFAKNLAVITIVAVLAFVAGTVFAEGGPPIVRVPNFFNVPVAFEGDFSLEADGTGTCNGSFTVDPHVWEEFRAGADYNGSVWTGIGEAFDGVYIDQDDPGYFGLWEFVDFMEDNHPWLWTH